jgi:predicted nucleic acid-binding protein
MHFRSCGQPVSACICLTKVARRVARLPASLADGFAAATAQDLGARLHTTDEELWNRLRSFRIPITLY